MDEENFVKVLDTPHATRHQIKRCKTSEELQIDLLAHNNKPTPCGLDSTSAGINLLTDKEVIRRAETTIQELATQPVHQTWTTAAPPPHSVKKSQQSSVVEVIKEEKYEGSVADQLSSGEKLKDHHQEVILMRD